MNSSRIHIIVVDDHELVRQTLCDRLGREPSFDVVATASNADEAIEMVRQHQPEIVLMDIDLAGVASLEATVSIAQVCPRVRIIFVSAFAHDRYIDYALQMNAHGYVTKRERLDSLIDAIRTVASGDRYFCEEIQERLVAVSAGQKKTNNTPLSKTRYSTLTPRQLLILKHIARGLSKKKIADSLQVSVKTIESHCETMMTRLGVHDRVGLARYAIREGMVDA